MRTAPGTWRLVAVPLGVGLALLAFSWTWSLLAVAAAGFAVWFHRDPDRNPPADGILAPADGTVSVVRKEEDRVRVGVFMNVSDVHVNRAPTDGTIEMIEHRPGAHRPAFSKDSDRNEKVVMDLGSIEVTLIAGAFARRIHPYLAEGDRVERGERIGHVSFGSRADVLLPPSIDRSALAIEPGDTVRAGETVIAPNPLD
jgi:phosphatidylserine decarboxylase